MLSPSRALPVALTLTLLSTLPLDAACSCGSDPPRMDGCRDPITDFSGVTSVEIVSAGIVRGFQGGEHFQYQIRATGTGLGECVSFISILESSGGSITGTLDAAVRADVTADGLVTRPIYHFNGYGSGGTVRATALGRTVTATIGAFERFDVPPPVDAPALDALGLDGSDGAMGLDAPAVDAP